VSRLPEFGRAPHTHAQGGVGERAAEAWLVRQGYRIVERNLRNHGGEVDLVASEGETLCFVEVKARASDRYGPAIAAVGSAKRRRLARAAALYLVSYPWPGPCRFDVLGLDRRADGDWEFTLVRDAFPVPPSA
jgi:putative endonuclease